MVGARHAVQRRRRRQTRARPGVAFDDLPKIDAVLVTHGHYDHLDVETLARLMRRDQPRIFAPLGNDATIAAKRAGGGRRGARLA